MIRSPAPLSAALAFGAAFALAPSARAADEGSCSVRLVGEDDRRGWRAAIAEEEARLAALPVDAHDCRLIEVHVTIDGAVVVFTTRDGRQAVRRIAGVAELGSTIDALLVTSPPAPITTSPPATKGTTSARPPTAAPPAVSPPAGAERGRTRVVAIVDVGARVGSPGRFLSPSLALGAHVLVDRWELGVEAALEPFYGTALRTPPGFQMLATVLGVGAGRREPIGGGFELVALGRASVALVHEEIEGPLETQEIQGTRSELRLGASASLVYARESRFRLRATLAGDFAPSKLSASREIDPKLPKLPTWGATLSIGVEADLQ